ncbi:MAG: alcohol dehydrogenase [Neomegalonema sp.]|nr:alcohol dehydrogenase [Neomegalonema sp.]
MRSYALVEFGKPLQVIDRPDPDPVGTEVLVRVTRSGVCHSDLHIADGYFDLGDGEKLRMEDRGMKLPHTLGHEILGEVIAAGPEASDAPVGQTMLVHPWIGCGVCEACAEDRDNDCMKMQALGIVRDGGYATHVIVPHPRYLVEIGDVDPSIAVSYSCAGVTVYSALKKALPLREGEWLVIMGAGGLGLNAVSIAKALGVERLACVDLDPEKLAAARDLGADLVIEAGQGDPAAALAEGTGANIAAVLDTVGAPATAAMGVKILKKTGRFVIVGLFGGALKLSLPILPQRALTLRGSYVGSCGELKELMALVRAGKVKPIPVTERPLCEASQTLDDLRAGKVLGRVVLTG